MEELGLKTIVIHPGSALKARPEDSLLQIAKGLDEVLKVASKFTK